MRERKRKRESENALLSEQIVKRERERIVKEAGRSCKEEKEKTREHMQRKASS